MTRQPRSQRRIATRKWTGHVRPTLHALEERAVPATFTVTNAADSGAGSLRQAVLDANAAAGADTVDFDPITFATLQTIGLTSGEMSITQGVSINGPGANLLTLTGGPVASATNRFFNISTSEAVSISSMTLAKGQVTGNGGAILAAGKVQIQLTNMAFDNNTATVSGGAFYRDGAGTLDISSSTFSNNSAKGGGAIFSNVLTITNSTLVGNTAGSGGAIFGNPTARNCTITGNTETLSPSFGGGGGVFGVGTYSSCIVAGNNGEYDILTFGTPRPPHPSGDNNLIGSASPSFQGSGNILSVSDPKVEALGNNGGPTTTCALKYDSPAIDAGNNAAGLSYDQRGTGFPRVQGKATDIGAFEFPVPYVSWANLADVTTTGGVVGAVTLKYIDDVAINVSTIDVNDVKITGPNGFIASLTGVTVDVPTDGTPRLATYSFTPPGGSWDVGDDGTYTVTVIGNQVFDTDLTPNSVPAGSSGTFHVAILTVNATNDESIDTDGKLSLREAIQLSNVALAPSSIITFDPSVFSTPQTINLPTGQLTISKSVTITGPGSGMLTIKNTAALSGTSRVIYINSPGASDKVDLTGLTITGGNVTGSGGGILASTGNLTLTRCTVSNNTAVYGGGVHAGGKIWLTVVDSTISGNSAAVGAGGIGMGQLGYLFVTGSTIDSNTAGGSGGGMSIKTFDTGDPNRDSYIRNSTISGNKSLSATLGGGGHYLGPDQSNMIGIENCTITGNQANGAGGGIRFAAGVSRLHSTILAGNSSPNGPDIAFLAPPSIAFIAGTDNVIGVADATKCTIDPLIGQYGTPAAPLDALLGPLAHNGGPTRTHLPLTGSPAIDKGNNNYNLSTDQRGMGYARVVNGKADVGAVERQAGPPTVAFQQINDGSAQRSMVTRYAITFSEDVTFSAGIAAAIQIQRTGPGAPTGAVILDFNQTGNVVTVTFSDPVFAPTGQSLTDGNYTLTFVASKIQGVNGLFDGNGDGTGGDNRVETFHRLFGDGDGDGDVDINDFGMFRTAFGTSNTAFDFDNDGDVDAGDYGQFRLRFGATL